MKKLLLRAVTITTFIFVFFISVPFALAFFAKFVVNVPTVTTTLGSLESITTPFAVSIDVAYLSFFDSATGGAKYKIEHNHSCDVYDEDGNCIDENDLCPYISLEPKDEESTEIGFSQNASNPYNNALGEINGANDTLDNWEIKITSPCFEGECPADYDYFISGVPLSQSLKGKTFTCELRVTDASPIFPVKRMISPMVAYAQTAHNVVAISATLTGELLTPPPCASNCFSNVLFIPGLEASRLYLDENGLQNQLWEPNRNLDVEKLYLNENGISKNTGIYTEDIIKETNTPVSMGMLGQNIYKSFSNMMDGLVTSEKISEWKAFPYDWRMGVEDVVEKPVDLGSGKTLSLIPELKVLIKSSKSGKVTIIAHSNGGLVAKALLARLQEMKDADPKDDMIDHVDLLILVAVPQIGTAMAVPSILHGYDQSMLGGWLMDITHARELGRNMPSAYGLLPSAKYINQISASPVAFTDNSTPSGVTTNFVNAYGNVVDSYTEYKNFLFGVEGRMQPAITENLLPIKLSSQLFTQAETLHNNIDTWTPPSSLRVVEVAGWGLDTIAGFQYYPKWSGCKSSFPQIGCTDIYAG